MGACCLARAKSSPQKERTTSHGERDRPTLILTCEHGGHRVPAHYRPLFAGRNRLLESHRGWDPGALELARLIANRTHSKLVFSTTTRLLVDLNRSSENPGVFSRSSGILSPAQQHALLNAHHTPYRERVEQRVRASARRAPAIHLSVHTFTPVLRGERRALDIGILFDPARPLERVFARRLRAALNQECPRSRVAFNKPYKGTDDGLTTTLRGLFPPLSYAGIELEVNQRFPRAGGPSWAKLQDAIARAIVKALNTNR